MTARASAIDFIAYDREGRIVLLAEAKTTRGASDQWAARLRRNMLSHGVLPWAKYFLIATPERLYLWKQERPDPSEVAPDFTIDATKEFQPWSSEMLRRLHLDLSDIGPEAFRLLVLTWLTDIARSDNGPDRDVSPPWLSEFTGSLQQARIEMNPGE